MSRAVTVSEKRYVFVCAGCHLLADSVRRHATTCSGACRVRLHRSPDLAEFYRRAAAMERVPMALVLQLSAIKRLRPDLFELVAAGTMTANEAQLIVWPEWIRSLVAAVEAQP